MRIVDILWGFTSVRSSMIVGRMFWPSSSRQFFVISTTDCARYVLGISKVDEGDNYKNPLNIKIELNMYICSVCGQKSKVLWVRKLKFYCKECVLRLERENQSRTERQNRQKSLKIKQGRVFNKK